MNRLRATPIISGPGTAKVLYTAGSCIGERSMRHWPKSPWAALAAVAFVAAHPVAFAASCDEYDPGAPARSAEITLNGSDFVDRARDGMQSFVATGSLGQVDAAIVSASPKGVVRSFSATPEVSRYSPRDGEALKGIGVSLSLEPTRRPVAVVVRLRQVCAQFFRNTFLYY